MISLLLLPFRLALGSTKLAYKSGRLVGYRRLFVLGTGNHLAGWRYEGAATSSNQLPVIQ